MDNMQRLESQISMYHTIFMICIVLFVLFLLVDIFLFIKLDIRKVIGFLTGKTARKTIEEMKAGGFGESARLSGKVSGTKKKISNFSTIRNGKREKHGKIPCFGNLCRVCHRTHLRLRHRQKSAEF